jgi:DNA-binding YbaB/EbfC family protein
MLVAALACARRPGDLRRVTGGSGLSPDLGRAAGAGFGQTSEEAADAAREPQRIPGGHEMGMANLQRMAMQMQQDLARVQQELAETTVEGTAGGGVVKAVANGKQELVSVTIDPSAVDPADVEMLQDLIVAAVTDAQRAARELAETKMAAVTGGLKLPGM